MVSCFVGGFLVLIVVCDVVVWFWWLFMFVLFTLVFVGFRLVFCLIWLFGFCEFCFGFG